RNVMIRHWPLCVALLVCHAPGAAVSPDHAAAEASRQPAAPVPPVAARKPERLTAHGIERIDDYAWLRDPNWRAVMENPSVLAPEIRAYIEAENAYADAILAPLADLRAKLVSEMKGRIDPADSGVPLRDGPYAYWSRFVPGAEHPRLVRAPSNGGPEELLVDG